MRERLDCFDPETTQERELYEKHEQQLNSESMSIYICTICNNQKDSDFNCAELDGKECCEECFETMEEND